MSIEPANPVHAVAPESGANPAEELAYRLRQQELVAAFGLYALGSTGFDALLQESTRICAKGLQTSLCKALEYLPEANTLLVRAGVGWKDGVIGHATIGADLESPAGFALHTGQPVISNHLQDESRFRTPKLLAEHGVRRAINVIIRSGGKPFGVLEADSSGEGRFTAADIAFMQGLANLLGVAIDRQRADDERTQATARLQLEQARLAAVLEQMPSGVAIAEAPSGRVVSYNGAALRLLGLDPDAVADPAMDGAAAAHGMHSCAGEHPLARALRGEVVIQEEVECRRADGSQTCFRISAAPVRDADGDIVLAVSTFDDIGEQRRTAAALGESEEQLRLVIDGARDYAISITDSDGRFAHWFPGAEATFGWSAQDIIGQPSSVIFTPEDVARGEPQAELERARRDGVAPIERWHLRRDGTCIFMSGSVRALHDAHGRNRGFLKVSRDVTAERRTAEALRLSEERLRIANAAAQVGTWDLNPLTGELFWDARCRALFGLSADSPVSLDTFWSALHPDDREPTAQAMSSAMADEDTPEFAVEYRARGIEDGVERWIAANGRVLFENGRPARFIGTVLDIGLRKQSDALMRDTLAHQEILTREVSHRVKNSLQLVAGLLGLQARAARDEGVRRALTDAQTRVGTIAQVHDQLWRLNDVRQVDLADFLGDLGRQLQGTSVEHRLVIDAEPIPVSTDRAIPIGLIVNELVTNAFKYAYPEGGGGLVRVTLRRQDGCLWLDVADRGIGLPDGFDPAQRRNSLGMRLITNFARQLDATFVVQPGEPGTRFRLAIPLADAGAGTPEEA